MSLTLYDDALMFLVEEHGVDIALSLVLTSAGRLALHLDMDVQALLDLTYDNVVGTLPIDITAAECDQEE